MGFPPTQEAMSLIHNAYEPYGLSGVSVLRDYRGQIVGWLVAPAIKELKGLTELHLAGKCVIICIEVNL